MNLLKKFRKDGEHEKVAVRPVGGALAEKGHQGESGLARLRHELDRTFDRMWRGMGGRELAFGHFPSLMPSLDWPALDVAEDDKAVTVRADVPGLDARDLDIEISGNQLTIRGSRQDEWSEKQGSVQRRERVSGSFVRTVNLPTYVDAAGAQAKYEKGTVTITVPKRPGEGARKVNIQG